MSLVQNFEHYLLELRQGDEAAIDKLLAEFEPYIRRTLRFHIKQASLHSIVDSVDVFQSVMSSFLIRLSAGEYEIQDEKDLRHLIASMARKKFLMLNRHESAIKRDHRKTTSLETLQEIEMPCQKENPNRAQRQLEVLAEIRQRLGEDLRVLFDRRRAGIEWEAIAAEFGENAAVLRQRLSRALRKLSKEVLDEDEDWD
jgi:RNA polymerase sigma factor (sigma-70 family)